MSTDPHNDWGDVDLITAIRAHREQEKHDEAMTDEQREIRARRRAILGDAETTRKLNRDERGSADAAVVLDGLIVVLAVLLVGLQAAAGNWILAVLWASVAFIKGLTMGARR